MARQIGIQFVAEGEEEFTQAMTSASQAEDKVVVSTDLAGKAFTSLFNAFKSIGATPLEALTTITAAMEQGTKPAELLNEIYSTQAKILKDLAGQGMSWAQIQKELNVSAKELTTSETSEAEEAKILMETHQRVTQAYAEQAKVVADLAKIEAAEAQAVASQVSVYLQVVNAKVRGAVASGDFAEAEKILNSALQETNLTQLQQINLTNDLARVQDLAARSTSAGTQASVSSFQTVREGRLLISALTAEMSLAAIAAGTTLPQGLREAARGLQEVISIALLGFVVGGPVGAGIGAIIGLVTALATASTTASKQQEVFNTSLDTLAHKDDAVTFLTVLTGWTKDQAQAAYDAAKGNAEYAAAIQHLGEVEQQRAINQAILARAGPASAAGQAAAGELARLPSKESLEQSAAAVQKAADTDKYYADQTKLADDKLKQFQTDLSDSSGAAQQNNAIDALARRSAALQQLYEHQIPTSIAAAKDANDKWLASLKQGEQDAKAAAEALHTMEDALTSLGQRLDALNTQHIQQTAAAFAQFDEAVLQANRTLDESLARSFQTLADRQADIQQQYNDRVSDIEFQHQQQLESLDQQRIQQRQQLANRLLDILFQELQQEAALSFNAQQSEETATTYAQVLQIRERADFQRQQIENSANHQRQTARQGNQDQQAQDRLRRQQIEENYQHELDVANRTKNEELAKAQRTFAEETARARQANADQLHDLQVTLTARNLAIDQSYAAEILAIQQAEDKAKEAYDFRIAQLTTLTTAQDAYTAAINRSADALANMGGQGAGVGGSNAPMIPATGAPFFAGGADFTVSSPTMFIAGEAGPEHVMVTPTGGSTNGGGLVVNFNAPIWGVDDLDAAISSAVDAYDKSH